MHVLVTGGAGYEGCWIIPLLLERGHTVRLFDRFCFGREPIQGFESSPDCEIIEGDIRRLQEFPDLFDGIDGIIHLAGLANDPSCDLDPELTVDVNVESTHELANLAVQNSVRRFIFASSCSVYGKGVFEILDEKSPANPVSAYAVSKVDGEKILLGLKSEHFEPVISRTATLFGWSPRMRFDLAINLMTATAMRDGAINVMGGGNQWRPFIHVKDAALAKIAFLEAPADQVSGEIFNVGEDEANIRIRDLAKMVHKHIPEAELKISLGDEDTRSYHVQFGKLHEVLGYSRTLSIDDGIVEIKEKLSDATIDPFDEKYFNVRRMKKLIATPVEEGGEPIAPRLIPMARPVLGVEEEKAVVEALRSGWITSGPHVAAFEKAFCETVQGKEAVAVSSCTAAIHLCLVHLGVRPGDEVITSPLTWPSVANVIVNMGATLVLADIQRETLNMDPESLKRAITVKTKAIIPVHMAGQPCDLDAIRAIAAEKGIPIIEDAAHALGSSYKGTPIGGGNDLSCFSFYAIKNVTTMEGGMISLSDAEDAQRLRRLASHGISATAWDRYGRSAVPAPPEVVEPGYKYLMGNVSAAIGLEQLKKFADFQTARSRIAGLYRVALADIDDVWMPEVADPAGHSWHLMIIRFKLDPLAKSRNEIAHALRRENIGTGFHFHALHLHKYYAETLGYTPQDLPEASAASSEVLSLPLYPSMTDKNVHEVVSGLKKVLAHAH